MRLKMNRHLLLLAAALPSYIFSQEPPQPPQKSPAEIQQELIEDEALFKRATEMFNPWYTGPLITPSATMTAPGYGNIQPYVFVTSEWATYNNNRKSRSLPSTKVTHNPQFAAVFGITNTMDISVVAQASENWQFDKSGGGYSDMNAKVGWPITRQSLNFPAIKFSVSQTFPTGRYQKLNSNGFNLSSTGGGVWATQFGLAISKVMMWSYKHPVNARFYTGYTVSVPSTVRGFNAYGGGFGTRAKVKPGNAFIADLGLEFSLTQRWLISNDIVYSFQQSTHFSGNPGTTATGAPASLGGPYNDSLSLAPALEYSFSPNLGILGGCWFTVYGKNSPVFASGIITMSWVFGPM
jgi:hypothetical protein